MLVIGAGDPAEVKSILTGFRRQARDAGTGPGDDRRHGDGWGAVLAGARKVEGVARSVLDAFEDPAYEALADRAARTKAGSAALVHFRNASVGGVRRENTHPFVADGWAFAHNGTVAEPTRLDVPSKDLEGTTDSERLFRLVLTHLRRGRSPIDAIRSMDDEVTRVSTFSSLTCILTDGSTVYGYRRVGTDLAGCGTKSCQLEHYSLGVGRRGSTWFFAQEPTYLGPIDEWHEVGDGQIVAWNLGGRPELVASPRPSLKA